MDLTLAASFEFDDHASLLEFDSPALDLRPPHLLGHRPRALEDPETGATLQVVEVIDA